jgi:hypothetical protein
MKDIFKFLLLVLVAISLLIPLLMRPKDSHKKEKKVNYKEIDTIQKKSDSIFIYRVGSN